MILSSVPSVQAVPWPWFAGLAAWWPTRRRHGPRRPCAGWPTLALSIGWLAHGVALALDIWSASGAWRAVRLRAGAVGHRCGSCWRCTRWKAASAAARRAARAGPGWIGGRAARAWRSPAKCARRRHRRWLPLHWLLGIASYGLFGAAVLHAWLLDGAERRMRLKTGTPAGGMLGIAAAAPGAPHLPLRRGRLRGAVSAALLLGLQSAATTGAGTTRRCFPCWAGPPSRS